MPNLPVTGNMTYDFVLAGLVVVLGVGIALKAERNWGWLLVGGAVAWAFFLLRSKGLV